METGEEKDVPVQLFVLLNLPIEEWKRGMGRVDRGFQQLLNLPIEEWKRGHPRL